MTIKINSPEIRAENQRLVDAAAEAARLSSVSRMNQFYNEIIRIMPREMTYGETNGVFLHLLVVGIIGVHDRVKSDAVGASKRLGKALTEMLKEEWGSERHQALLASRSMEVN